MYDVRVRRFACVSLMVTSCGLFPSLDALTSSDAGSGPDAKIVDSGGGEASDVVVLPDAGNPTYIRAITIHNNASGPLPQGYTIGVAFPESELQAASTQGKMRSDLNDLRLGGTTGERDRLVDVPPLARVVWFSLASPIAANATDTTYAITYGVPNAPAPPENGANVFAFYDDFSSALDTSRWMTQGTVNVSGGMVSLPHGGEGALTTLSQPPLSTCEFRAQVTDPSSAADGTGFYYWFGFQHTGDFVASDPWVLWIARSPSSVGAEDKANGCTNGCNDTPQGQTNALRVYGIERQAALTNFSIDGAPAWSTPATNDQALSLMIRNFLVTGDVVVDWIRSRPRIYPEPTVTLGAEQLK